MSDQEADDMFGGAELSDSDQSAPATPEHNDGSTGDNADTGAAAAAAAAAETETTATAGDAEAAEAAEEEEEEPERVVLPRCPDVVGAYQGLCTMRLPRLVRTVAEPYTRAGFVAAQKRAGGSLADAEKELLAIRWRRVNGRTESNARLVRWSDGTAQILVGTSRVLDVIPRSGGTTLHVGVRIAPSVTQDLGFPTVGYLASVPRDEMGRLRRLAGAAAAAAAAAASAAAGAGDGADGADDDDDLGDEGAEAAIIAECQSSSSSSSDDDEDDDAAGVLDGADDDGAAGGAHARARRPRAAVTLVAEALDAAGDAAAQRQKSVAEQGHELARALAAKEQRLRRRTGGVLEPGDLADSDADDADSSDDGRGAEDRAAARLQRAKHQSLHGRR